MELAIPLVALGGMYVISNQSSNNTNSNGKKVTFKEPVKESFETAGRPRNYLPNVNIPPQNYPVTNRKELVNTVQEYVNPNTATDRYFDQNVYENRANAGKSVGNNPQQIYSLTGNYLNSKEFKHNNMVPFYGGKIKGYTYDTNIAESVLDNMAGTGSQVIKKIEQAPLFKPEENVQWAYGAPNQSDFFQSRVNPGMKNNNVKPFDTVNVGPGLGRGFTASGSGGYNSGMEDRNAWLPKTVDELRVDTNPKLEYSLAGHQGPAEGIIKNVGIQGLVEKQRPDTFFINTQDRWLTTTGAEKGETLRPIQELGVIRRDDCMSNYMGPALNQDRQVGRAPTEFEPTRRVQLGPKDVPISCAVGKGPSTDFDNRAQSFTNYSNNRMSVKQPDTMRSGFSSAVGAAIAPFLDMLRPTRKEEISQNVRIYGDVNASNKGHYVINPSDITPTTVKETTLYSPEFFINNQKEGIYVNNYTPMDLTQRDTTSCPVMGNVGGVSNQYGDMLYDSQYRQTNNDIKSSTIYNQPNPGGMQIFNQQMNVNIARNDVSPDDGRWFTPNSVTPLPPSRENYGKITMPQYYNECIGCERIDPGLLNAFRANPYTHSLTTSV
jgi:hypothetical protein